MGARRGLAGPTAPVLITWALLIRRHAPPFIIQENVPQFPRDILLDLLGTEYSVEDLLLDPRQRGWPVARKRRYAVFTHATAALRVPLVALQPLLDSGEHLGSADTFATAVAPRVLLRRHGRFNRSIPDGAHH